jgi:hypothetical protein
MLALSATQNDWPAGETGSAEETLLILGCGKGLNHPVPPWFRLMSPPWKRVSSFVSFFLAASALLQSNYHMTKARQGRVIT